MRTSTNHADELLVHAGFLRGLAASCCAIAKVSTRARSAGGVCRIVEVAVGATASVVVVLGN